MQIKRRKNESEANAKRNVREWNYLWWTRPDTTLRTTWFAPLKSRFWTQITKVPLLGMISRKNVSLLGTAEQKMMWHLSSKWDRFNTLVRIFYMHCLSTCLHTINACFRHRKRVRCITLICLLWGRIGFKLKPIHLFLSLIQVSNGTGFYRSGQTRSAGAEQHFAENDEFVFLSIYKK